LKKIIQALENRIIKAWPVWKPIHLQLLYKDCEHIARDSQDNSKGLFEQGLCFPSGTNLSISDQNRVIEIILVTI